MSGDDLDVLKEALESPGFTSRQIASALEAEGYEIRMRSVSRHRRGDCLGLS
jgi:repressor of nif and glnA expression